MPDTASDLIVIAHRYGISRLSEMCEKFYSEGIEVSQNMEDDQPLALQCVFSVGECKDFSLQSVKNLLFALHGSEFRRFFE